MSNKRIALIATMIFAGILFAGCAVSFLKGTVRPAGNPADGISTDEISEGPAFAETILKKGISVGAISTDGIVAGREYSSERSTADDTVGAYYDTGSPYFEYVKKDASLLARYRELNKDVVGIITIRDSILRHPVVQSPDKGEDFYLYHDLNLSPNTHGVPFLTLDSDLLKDGGNAILYGHNIIWTEPKDIFCDLINYENLKYYREHPVIEVVTAKGTAKYLIFLYALMDTADSDAFVYWKNTGWADEEEFQNYMEEMEKRNWLSTEIPYSIEDTFLTISTCSKELPHSGTNRMIVMAKRLRVGEEYEKYVKNAEMNASPYLPEKLRK